MAAVRAMSVCLWVCLLAAPAAALGQHSIFNCGRTIKHAHDRDCQAQFVQAVLIGNYGLVTAYCCGVLACVREATCAVVLHEVCGDKWVDRCAPTTTAAAGRRI